MAAFSQELRNASSTSPALLTNFISLSASDNSIVVNSFGTVSSKTVVAILYNPITSPVATLATLSAGSGIVFRASQSFNNAQIALEYSDRSSSLVTLTTAFGVAKVQNVSAAGFDNSSKNSRRLRVLGYS